MSMNLNDMLSKFGGGGGGGGGGNLLGSLMPALLGMLGGGGLSKIMSGFKAQGLTSAVDSWTSGGDNEPVSPDQVRQVLGDDEVDKLAQQAGVSKDEAADGIAQVLPGLVDQMSPEGQLPDDDSLSSMLGSLKTQADSMFGGK